MCVKNIFLSHIDIRILIETLLYLSLCMCVCVCVYKMNEKKKEVGCVCVFAKSTAWHLVNTSRRDPVCARSGIIRGNPLLTIITPSDLLSAT